MPTRYIKETVCTSETLAALSAEAERFWYRLIVTVDDYGRYDARLPVLRANCFSMMLDKVSEKDVAKWLTELEHAGLLILYTVEGKRYLEILTFCKYNKPRASTSKYPDPPADARSCMQLPTIADDGAQIPSKSKSKSKSNSDAGADLPAAVKVYESNGGEYQSGKLAGGISKRDKARQFIAENVRDDALSLDLWGKVVGAYCAMWSSKSYQVMVNEYYLNKRIPGQRTNGKNGYATVRLPEIPAENWEEEAP